MMMQIFQGKSVSRGIAMGPVVFWRRKNFITERKQIADAEAEIERLDVALKLSKAQLKKLQESIISEETGGGVAAVEYKKARNAVLEAHLVLLEDDGFTGRMREMIQDQQLNAEYAVQQVSERIAEMFAGMGDEYMRQRVADFQDIAERILQNLGGGENTVPTLTEQSLILAEDLSPGETMQFDRNRVLAFVTAQGAYYSHAAILARSMGIPALVGVNFEVLADMVMKENSRGNIFAIVDAMRGQLIFNPDSRTLDDYNMKVQQEQERKALLQVYKNQESVTRDGHKIRICANVGNVFEVQEALENGADGIGLFRSEFLYLGRDNFPTEEEQFEEYKRAVITMGHTQVSFRTLDIGVDKQVDYFRLEQEANPALGYRGIRICLKEQEIFKVQLRALLRATVYGNLAIMYPMITSVEEVEQIQRLVKQAAKELELENIPYRIPAQGIMIETPAAVMISDELAEMVDFFSIGTNDLTQYTLAMDRQNAHLDEFYDSHHKAIFKMIQMTVDNAHKAGKWVGICGELAADTTLTETFIRMGVDELSVVSGKVLELRKTVCETRVN